MSLNKTSSDTAPLSTALWALLVANQCSLQQILKNVLFPKIDVNKIFDISELFRCYFKVFLSFFFYLSILCLFYSFAFLCFVVLCFVIDPKLIFRRNVSKICLKLV